MLRGKWWRLEVVKKGLAQCCPRGAALDACTDWQHTAKKPQSKVAEV